MWDGAFKPFEKGEVGNHFKIVRTERDDTLEMVTVYVEFEKSPGTEYVFEFPYEEWDGKKETIVNELLS